MTAIASPRPTAEDVVAVPREDVSNARNALLSTFRSENAPEWLRDYSKKLADLLQRALDAGRKQ